MIADIQKTGDLHNEGVIDPWADEVGFFVKQARPPKIRSVLEFAEDEIVIPK